MAAIFAFGFLLVLLVTSPPVSAQSPCAECIKAAQEELRNCLDHAISVDDKNTCEENREEGFKRCEEKVCTAEREDLQREERRQDR